MIPHVLDWAGLVPVSVPLPPEDVATLTELAEAHGLSLAAYLAHVVAEHLAAR